MSEWRGVAGEFVLGENVRVLTFTLLNKLCENGSVVCDV